MPVMSPPPGTDTVLLASNVDGRQIVSIHSKVTYQVSSNGTCRRADTQQPLLVPDSRAEGEQVRETDITPIKTGTDLIVLATAQAPAANTREMRVRIGVGRAQWEYCVVGDRRCLYGGPGTIAFSSPEPFEQMPLRYEHAYGGFDEGVTAPPIRTLPDAFKPHPGMYPRNPVGRGFVVHETSAIDGLLLPNIEHPQQRITPKTLVTGAPENWWRQPVPWSCDWFDKTWYPRITYFGGLPEHLPDDDSQVTEVRWGLVASGQKARHARLRLEDAIDPRFTNAASPALVLPFLRGDESVLLEGVTLTGRLAIRLPAERPRMFVRFEGRAHELTPIPHRILISTDEMGAYVVWQGTWFTPRRLPDRFPRAGDDARMELEGIEVFADGKLVDPLV